MEVTYEGGSRFSIMHRGHQVTVDLTPENGGEDAGMGPPELFVGALAACVGVYALSYFKNHGLDPSGLRVTGEFQVGGHPKRIERMDIHLTIPKAIEERHLRGIQAMANACLLHNTIHYPVDTTLSIGRAGGD